MLVVSRRRRPWTPAAISTNLWLDAGDTSTVTTVSGRVSEWRDKSGNSRHVTQTTPDWRPTYVSSGLNGRNIINLAGTSAGTGRQRLTNATAALLRNVSAGIIFVVGRSNLPADGGSRTLVTIATSVGNTRLNVGIDPSTVRVIAGGRRVAASSFQSITGVTSASNYGVYSAGADYSATTLGVRGNGALEASTNTFQTAGITENDGGALSIAMDAAGTLADSNADIAETIVLERAPTTTERQLIEGYLAHRWGLAGLLVAGHPYITAPPYL